MIRVRAVEKPQMRIQILGEDWESQDLTHILS